MFSNDIAVKGVLRPEDDFFACGGSVRRVEENGREITLGAARISFSRLVWCSSVTSAAVR